MVEGGGGGPSRRWWRRRRRRGGPSSFPLVPESNEVKGVKVSGSRMRARLTAPYGDAGSASICSFTLFASRGRRAARRVSKKKKKKRRSFSSFCDVAKALAFGCSLT